ncbi:unnamed protein product [Adineta steineri]|uniref:Uncharacterized protein n=1 Tax=Adineta steineri TaxID=433720 RepID=A0A814MEM8_9BILA|nr:unnamed protein product [Adineta steineri]CAF3956677.1 unnamed protein product [Adineta steineri]
MVIESTSKTASRIQVYLSHPKNLMKTGYLILTWVMMGFHLELIGPTLSIIAANLKVTYSGMGSVLASRSAGYLIADLLGAILQNIVKNHSEGLLFCAFILPAVVVFTTPFVTSLILMCVLSFIQGLSKGFTDLGGNNLLLKMWTVNAAAPLNLVHLGYGVGAIFSNLLVQPFITQKNSSLNVTNHVGTNATHVNPNIVIPYSITAVLCFFVAIGHMLFYILVLRNRRQKSQEQQFDKFNLSTEAASWALTLFWLSGSVGRLIFAIISVFLSVKICLNIIWFGALCLAAAWLVSVWVVGLTSTSLFILGVVTGFIFFPIFPLSFGYFNQRLNVTPMLLGLLLCGTALGAMTFSKIAGLVMDHDPNHFPTLLAVCILMTTIIYIVSHLVHFVHQRKNLSHAQSSANNDTTHSSEGFREEEQQITIA